MGGGLMQLVAYGAQDIYLSGNPQITFFKVVYRRHTNFSMESIEQTFNGKPDFDNKVTCTISRNGDLISRMYLQVELDALPSKYEGDTDDITLPNVLDGSYKYKVYPQPNVSDLDKYYVKTGNADVIQMSNNNAFEVSSGSAIDPDTIITVNYDDDSTSEFEFDLHVYADFEATIKVTYSDLDIAAVSYPITNSFTIVDEPTPDSTGSIQVRDENNLVYNVYDSNEVLVNYTGSNTIEFIDFPKQEWLGHKIIDSVEIEIGGQRIDKHYGDWLAIWNELSQTEGHWNGYKQMVEGTTLYIPLQFWFNRNPGLALPLIALQYHEVKLNIKFSPKVDVYDNLITPETDSTPAYTMPVSLLADVGNMRSASLYVDYIYLDTDERRRFAQVSHEYLIEQLQFTGDESGSNKIKMNFNHPVKELIWVEKNNTTEVGTYTTTYDSAKIQLNGHERFSVRKPSYFQCVQPYQHHNRVPTNKGINVYSFALKPEEHQPSGTCNMSRIDNATLNLDGVSKTSTIKVFAVNYNVLRVMSGMGGLAYSN
tara:strand:- start:135 stop:1748 length:1614 start_codon:yes stop_codon:yes gene_type:complete